MTLTLVAAIVKVDAEIRGVLAGRKGLPAHQNVIRVHHVQIAHHHHHQPKHQNKSQQRDRRYVVTYQGFIQKFGVGVEGRWKGRGNITNYVPPSIAKSIFLVAKVLHGASEHVYTSSLFLTCVLYYSI